MGKAIKVDNLLGFPVSRKIPHLGHWPVCSIVHAGNFWKTVIRKIYLYWEMDSVNSFTYATVCNLYAGTSPRLILVYQQGEKNVFKVFITKLKQILVAPSPWQSGCRNAKLKLNNDKKRMPKVGNPTPKQYIRSLRFKKVKYLFSSKGEKKIKL